MPECPALKRGDAWHPLQGTWGSLFKPTTICPVVFGTAVRQAHGPESYRRAPNSDVIMVAAPHRKVACMTGLSCACPVTNVQAMGAAREKGLNWVAVLKRDPHAPGLSEKARMSHPLGRGGLQA